MADPDAMGELAAVDNLPPDLLVPPRARITIGGPRPDDATTDYRPDAFEAAAEVARRRYPNVPLAVLPESSTEGPLQAVTSLGRGLAAAPGNVGRVAETAMGRLADPNFYATQPPPAVTSGGMQAPPYVAPGQGSLAARIGGTIIGAPLKATIDRVMLPGKAISGEFNPFEQDSEAADWAAETAMGMIARGVSGGAPAGALGATGGKIVIPGKGIQPTQLGELAALPSAVPIPAGDLRVSTRFPTAVAKAQDPLAEHLSIGLPEMQASPGYAKNISLLDSYPGFAHLQGMSTDEAARAYIRQAAGNLDYLYRRSPEIMQQRSPLWYEGAHEVADAFARRWGVPRQSVSAVLASLSPQMDWFKNASLGERVGDLMTSAAAGRPMTSEMGAMARSDKMLPLLSGERTGTKNREALAAITGKSFDQLTDPLEQALWLRLYDEAHNSRAYRTITPEGNFGNFVVGKSGEPKDVGWGGLDSIRKAIQSMRSGGDINVISPLLGREHKVRSFYNNIEVPNYPHYGDVTADTHQVAAAQMRPLSTASPAVEHNLSGGAGGSGSDITGVRGTYGLTADATRMMAAGRGLVPRAGQSATWEPVRELFGATWKTPENAFKVDEIWRAFDRGEISIDQARDAIFHTAGGIGTPSWGERGLAVLPPARGSTYR
jgi:hypothetical protein